MFVTSPTHVAIFIIILDIQLTDFTSKAAMENEGWVFGWNDQNVFAPVPATTYCIGVPATSYCGFTSPGDLIISYTFPNGENGVATLGYGQSWDSGYVTVSINNVVIDSRNTRGASEITFDYNAGDILRIIEIGESVINIHGLVMKPKGLYDIHFELNMLQNIIW